MKHKDEGYTGKFYCDSRSNTTPKLLGCCFSIYSGNVLSWKYTRKLTSASGIGFFFFSRSITFHVKSWINRQYDISEVHFDNCGDAEWAEKQHFSVYIKQTIWSWYVFPEISHIMDSI